MATSQLVTQDVDIPVRIHRIDGAVVVASLIT